METHSVTANEFRYNNEVIELIWGICGIGVKWNSFGNGVIEVKWSKERKNEISVTPTKRYNR